MSKAPKYRDGRELQAPKRPPTPAQLNDAARELWARPETQLYVVAKAMQQASEVSEQKKRATGARRSAEVRAAATRDRDRRIHDADTKGVKAKQIAGDVAIVGDEKLSASQIRRILNKPRP